LWWNILGSDVKTPDDYTAPEALLILLVGVYWLGEKISFNDSRDRLRTMMVLEIVSPTRIRVGLKRTVYLKEGLELHGDLSGSSFTVGPIKPQPIELRIKAGEVLRLYKNNGILGHKVTADKPAGITCTLPEVLHI
jgi:pyruvate kinase